MTNAIDEKYLLGENGIADLEKFISIATLFAFDLDGTLAPIVPEPSAIKIPDEIARVLYRLSQIASVIVITGRSKADAMLHLGFNPFMVAGNHGAEGLPGHESAEQGYRKRIAGWERELHLLLPDSRTNGIIIENKGASLSLHYRNSPDPDAAREMIASAIVSLSPGAKQIKGKNVENIVCDDAPDKGSALEFIIKHFGFSNALFAGDDETDEDVFRLNNSNIFTIRVGSSRNSSADYFLNEQSEIAEMIRMIIYNIEKQEL